MDEKGKKMPNFDGPQGGPPRGDRPPFGRPPGWPSDGRQTPHGGTSGWPARRVVDPPWGDLRAALPREDLRSEARRVVLQWAARRCSRCIRCRTWATP